MSADALALLERLEQHTSADDLHTKARILHWRNAGLSADDISVLHTHVFCRRFEQLEQVDLTGSLLVRGANGSHCGVGLLSAAFEAGYFTPSVLSFGSNRLTDADAVWLLNSIVASGPATERLAKLYLPDNALGDRAAALLSSGALSSLEVLSVESNAIDEAGAQAFAEGTWPKLFQLYAHNNLFGDEGVERIAAACATEGAALHGVQRLRLDLR